jgi:hypothetical protein
MVFTFTRMRDAKQGDRGAVWRSFSGPEGNDKAIVKQIFVRESWRKQGAGLKRKKGTSRLARVPLAKRSYRAPVREGRRNSTPLTGVPPQSIVRLLKCCSD